MQSLCFHSISFLNFTHDEIRRLNAFQTVPNFCDFATLGLLVMSPLAVMICYDPLSYGFSNSLPVVFLPSKSVCALAISES